jgi:hypothetical protein
MTEYFPEQTSDDTDVGWNDEDSLVTDEEYLEDVPPHHED